MLHNLRPRPTSQTRLQQRSTSLIAAFMVVIFLVIAAGWFSPAHAGALGPEDPPDPTEPAGQDVTSTQLLPPELAKPILPADPTGADLGSITWWGVCMACHGDKGQGLTDEWRELAFGEDMNCWQSKCHASNHPPEGFVLVRQVPPAIGPGTLKRFVTAADLQHYLKTKMPWWDPGSLSEEEAWQLTAFLLRSDGLLPAGKELSIGQASFLPVHLPVRPVQDERGWQIILLGALGLAAVGLFSLRTWTLSGVANGSIVRKAKQLERPERSIRPSFFHHLHPPSIPLSQARWRYTLGAGGLAVFLSLMLAVTGVLEMFFYIPTPEQAGPSIQIISYSIPYGMLVRGLHFWAAQALVVVAVIHLMRVVLTGAFVPPRRFNYLLGLGLLVIILFLDFTGYVLRWDEGIRWALMVGTNLLKTIPLVGEALYGFVVGGEAPGLATLNRFYTWHIFGLTLILISIVVWHIFRVRRDGGISAPPPELRSDPRRITRGELVRREVIVMALASAGLILAATLFPAPIAPPISDPPTILTEEVRAPWFFLWIQQLLRHGGAFWMGVGIPLGLLGLLVLLPYIFKHLPEDQRGRWLPRTGRLAQIIAVGIILAWLALTVLEMLE
jgi:quinol-cytochrome oxidoreductase complex cytochrome b subunit